MRRAGRSKAEVERATGSTIGAYDNNFDVNRGEIFVIIGLSGSGKSTILRAINGLNEPTEGNVFLDGDNISKMSAKELREVRRRKIGMVFQHFGLLPTRTVMDNVTFGLEVKGASSSERKNAGEEALQLVGLQGQGKKMTSELSGGMQQRVGLARALATKQEILLMDEPFSALDPLIRRDMQNLFLRIQGEVQRTVVFVTHDLDEALMLGHRVAIMKDGEIVQLGTPEEILREPATDYVERFVEDVDYAKVRTAESVMVPVKEVAYLNEGPDGRAEEDEAARPVPHVRGGRRATAPWPRRGRGGRPARRAQRAGVESGGRTDGTPKIERSTYPTRDPAALRGATTCPWPFATRPTASKAS
jgi:glycine betaine/proline transport system ATP-binding protein